MAERITGSWEHERYCAAIEEESDRFVRAIGTADLATPVPTCPGWTVGKLVRHLGIAQRWAEHIVRVRVRERLSSRDVPVELPGDDSAYPAWLATGAARLVDTLRAAGPDAETWSWGADQRALFWSRRMLCEAVVHRADAELAIGRVPSIDPETAVEGVEEFLTGVLSAEWVATRLSGLDGEGQTIHLHATDADGEWTITLGPGGTTWERGHGKGTAAVRGDAGDLLLFLYGRLKPGDERLTVYGDEGLLARWQEKSSF